MRPAWDPTDDSDMKDVVVDDQRYILDIIEFRSNFPEDFQEKLIRHCNGAILAYSITSRASFQKIQDLYNQVHTIRSTHTVRCAGAFPISIVGCKGDCEGQRRVEREEGEQFARQHPDCRFAETSAKEGQNVEQGFENLVQIIHELRAQQQHKVAPKAQATGRTEESDGRQIWMGRALFQKVHRFLTCAWGY
jgi:GTPase SAR1 family protein